MHILRHLLAAALLALIPLTATAQIAPRDTTTAVPQDLLSAGEGEGFRGWGRAVYGTADQGVRGGQPGFDARSAGFAMGVDTALKSCPAVVGASVSYMNTRVDTHNGNTTETDVDGFALTLYGDYDMGQQTFLNGYLSYGFNDNESVRHNAGGPGINATGDYDANQFDAGGGVARYFQLGGATVTPELNWRYLHYSPDAYTETGPGPANLFVAQEEVNVLEFGAQLGAAWVFEKNDGSGGGFSPGLYLGFSYDVLGEKTETLTAPAGGGPSATTFGPDVARARMNGGASFAFFTGSGFDFKAAYDFDIKSDYVAQAGTLRATGRF